MAGREALAPPGPAVRGRPGAEAAGALTPPPWRRPSGGTRRTWPWGRLVLLYDPDGQQGWDGLFRLVAYVRADVEPEMAADPLLGEVGWSWLSEALDARVPGYAVPSGTVTRVITEGFGAKQDEVPLTGFELRASWSPTGPDHSRLRRSPAISTPSTCRRTSRPGATACRAAAGRRNTGLRQRDGDRGSERPRGGRRGSAALSGRTATSDAELSRTEADGIVPLLEPRDGLPPVVTTDAALAEVTGRLAAGEGPVAVDAERASGFRYGQRAYLVQLRRAGAGTVLIDPIACPDLSGVDAALDGRRGGAARGVPGPALPGRDRLPAAAAVRHRTGRAAARLSAGGPRHARREGARLPPGEGPCGGRLVDPPAARGTGSATRRWTSRCWSSCATRWRPSSKTRARPSGPGRSSRRCSPPGRPGPRPDPWRRTSGIHRVQYPPRPGRRPRALAGTRPDRAAARPVPAPGAARHGDRRGGPVAARPTAPQLAEISRVPRAAGPAARQGAGWPPSRRARAQRRRRTARGTGGPAAEWPAARPPLGRAGPGGRRSGWRPCARRDRGPGRRALAAGREPAAPDAVRRLSWQPPEPCDRQAVADALAGYGARPWQVELTAEPIARALCDLPAQVDEAAILDDVAQSEG